MMQNNHELFTDVNPNGRIRRRRRGSVYPVYYLIATAAAAIAVLLVPITVV